ncbi:structural maintenance of chromosomes protein 2-like [Prorops nasuta]|uniref:structural maintenance of chromosomes protein 2-like n=1 Tax=Prorops nasuta TaxID=863751 RepID=UPI0034CD9B9D
MNDLHQGYKHFEDSFNIVAPRKLRREEEKLSQHEDRFNLVTTRRNISRNKTKNEKVEDRKTKLAEWKEDRKKRKQTKRKEAKPPFKAGVLHYDCNDDLILDVNKSVKSRPLTRTAKGADRKLFASEIHKSKNNSRIPRPINYIKRKDTFILQKDSLPADKFCIKEENMFASKNIIFTPKKQSILKENTTVSRKSITMGEELSRTAEKNPDLINVIVTPLNTSAKKYDPAFFSPYVVTSRGKSNARKEQKIRRGLSMSPANSTPTKETVMENLNISIEDEERTAQYFKILLDKEIERLQELCDKWAKVKEEVDITEDASYHITQAIGQTGLLINKKFERFRGLAEDCESGKGQMLVTCKDLQGFWDMMYMDIKNCNIRFETLEKLKNNNWQEDQPENNSSLVIRKVVKKKKLPEKKNTVSKLKSVIKAARKKKTKGKNMDSVFCIESNTNVKSNNSPRRSKNVTPIKRNETKSPLRLSRNSVGSLLQQVQISEACKGIISPLAMIKISKNCNSSTVQTDTAPTYINYGQTPGKSILKQTGDSVKKDLQKKTLHKVNFDKTITLNKVPVDDEVLNKLDVAVALERIKCFDLNYYTNKSDNLERQLFISKENNHELDNELSNNQKNSLKNNTIDLKLVNKSIFQDCSVKLNNENKKLYIPLTKCKPFSAMSSETIQNISNMSIEDKPSKRILRPRTLIVNYSPSKRKNSIIKVAMNKDKNGNKISRKNRRKSFLVINTVDAKDESKSNIAKLKPNKLEKSSTRKSVKFPDCTEFMENKQVLPISPNYNRKKSIPKSPTVQANSDTESMLKDVLLDTPKNKSTRVTRSHS